MKLTAFLLLFLAITSCNPDFHRQKHTNFGHAKGLKFVRSEKESFQEKESQCIQQNQPSLETEIQLAEILLEKDSALEYTAANSHQTDSFPDRSLLPFFKDEIRPEIADSIAIENYLKVLKSERNSNIIFGIASFILLAISIFVGHLPLIPIFAILLLISLLLVFLKHRKYRLVLLNPEKYPNPKDKKRFTNDHRQVQKTLIIFVIALSLVTFTVFLFFTLLTALGMVLNFYLFVWPLAAILLLSILSIITGRNYNRGQKLRGLEPDEKVISRNVWNWLMILTVGLISGLTFFYPLLK